MLKQTNISIKELFNHSEKYTKVIEYILTFENKKVSINNLINYINKKFNINLIFDNFMYLKMSKRLIFHLLIMDITIPKCYSKDCQNLVKYHQNIYSKFCSSGCSNKHPETIKNIELTSIKRYGVFRPSQSSQSKEKLKATNLKKFGFISSSMHPKIKEKLKATNLKRYHSISSSQKHLKNKDKYYDKSFIINNFLNKKKEFKLDEFKSFFNCSQVSAHGQLKRLSIEYSFHKGISRIENNIFNFISNNYSGKIIKNDRKILNGLELDIYIPDLKIAFEINGNYWHSYGKVESNVSETQNNLIFQKNRHLIKTEDCEKQGIQLIHIFENEFLNKMNIWKSVILNKIGLFNKRYYAGKLQIKEVSFTRADIFLEENHLQGKINSNIQLGLYDQNNLISLMTFGEKKISNDIGNKEDAFELLRFSSKLNMVCVGGFSKLIKYFKNYYLNDKILYSFENRKWSSHLNNVYVKNGFIKIKNTYPNFNVFLNSNPLKMQSPFSFQKHNLQKKLEVFDLTKTSIENIILNNYRIIWDCGNIKYKYKEGLCNTSQ